MVVTVTGCVLKGDYCEPGPAKVAVYGADGCAGHADFEAVSALGGTTVAEARKKFTNYCLPSQEWQYDCRQSDAGSLTCPIDQQSCGGGCDDGTTGSTYDQCNQCLSNGHKGLDGGTTCDGSCTPGDVSDPCFKGFAQSDLTSSGVAWTQMGETIEASSTSSGYDHGFGLYSRKVYMDAGTLSGDGKRVAVFQTYGGLSQEG